MEYRKTEPCRDLKPFIHFYWELKGTELGKRWERVFPDGCAGVLINLGDTCLMDNGSLSLEFGKTYVVGAMTSFKESFIDVHSSNGQLSVHELSKRNFTTVRQFRAEFQKVCRAIPERIFKYHPLSKCSKHHQKFR
ncbi:hypothetical protein NU10_13980 [Flavobacterium dauae]|uniref:DUF6597 domain-containing transcriptional factor n=1 Tax=Flavobacterium dauae TaxID=1563479 RepID=UPI001F2825C1|nr:DUF6597 domain-containing transcriptional factor [Flavobacterium dauae]WLD23795.1 hypothetical protein NU10_13980 [Flavobacterium dauae]